MERQPRSKAKRVALMVLLVVAAIALGGTAGLFNVEFHIAGHTIGAPSSTGFVVLTVVGSFLATRVSLPWYYVAWFLVPFAGFFALYKLLWRVSYLPWRDWDLRAGEATGQYDVRPTAKRHEQQVHIRTN